MKSKKVLLVDNEPQRRDHLRRLLQQQSIATLEAASCEEALQLLAAERVDLVLTETELPSMSGLYLLRQARERHPELVVILITHNASSYNLLQALRNSAYDFIVRPIDTGEILFSALERAFNHIELRRQNTGLLEELERNNDSLRRALKMMKALNASIERVAATTDIEELFMELLASAMRELQSQRGFLALFDRRAEKLALKVSKGIASEVCRQYSVGIPPGLTLALARNGEPLAVPGPLPEHLTQLADPAELANLFTPSGLLAAPLRLRERIVGIVVLSGQPNGQSYGEHALNFLIQLSHHAALALEKAGIIHQLKRGKLPPTTKPQG